MNATGFRADLAYAIGLCYYQQKLCGPAPNPTLPEPACPSLLAARRLPRCRLLARFPLVAFAPLRYGPALKHIAEIIERGVREHPELSVGSQTEGVDVRSVGNSMVLEETALVEAFNLKAAIEYLMKNFEAAQEALADMPPRSDEELDPVSLHNTALMRMDLEPADGFKKLNFLISNPPFPPETFVNLMLLYCKHQVTDVTA